MNKKEIRKDLYELFEQFSGRPLTTEVHLALKQAVQFYSEIDRQALHAVNMAAERNNKKMKAMAKIIYDKAWDAEILEKHIAFLKKLFEECSNCGESVGKDKEGKFAGKCSNCGC